MGLGGGCTFRERWIIILMDIRVDGGISSDQDRFSSIHE